MVIVLIFFRPQAGTSILSLNKCGPSDGASEKQLLEITVDSNAHFKSATTCARSGKVKRSSACSSIICNINFHGLASSCAWNNLFCLDGCAKEVAGVQESVKEEFNLKISREKKLVRNQCFLAARSGWRRGWVFRGPRGKRRDAFPRSSVGILLPLPHLIRCCLIILAEGDCSAFLSVPPRSSRYAKARFSFVPFVFVVNLQPVELHS